MKNYTLIIVIALFVAILIVAVGFASITNVELPISGNTVATADQNNFKVIFTDSETGGDGTTTTSIATNGASATMDVSGLSVKDEEATATFTITNNSTGLNAKNVSTTVTQSSGSEYFEITKTLAATTIAAGSDTTITVKVKLLKTPTADQTGTFTVTVSAEPEIVE